jgi:hypothetical protein
VFILNKKGTDPFFENRKTKKGTDPFSGKKGTDPFFQGKKKVKRGQSIKRGQTPFPDPFSEKNC